MTENKSVGTKSKKTKEIKEKPAKKTVQNTAKKKKKPNWEIITKEWVIGIKPASHIADEWGMARSTLYSHFEKRGIERNSLGSDIKRESERIVASDSVLLADDKANRLCLAGQSTTAEIADKVIRLAARKQADIVLESRENILKAKNLLLMMMAELELQTINGETLESLAEIMADGDMDRMAALMKKAISTPTRVESVKKITDALKTIIALERQAYGLSDNANGDADKPEDVKPVAQVTVSLESIMERLNSERNSKVTNE